MSEMKLQIIDGTQIRSNNEIRKGSGIHGSGTITRTWNGPPGEEIISPDKNMCRGCYEDVYNGELAKECWMFKSAIVCNKVGYSSIHVANGQDTKMEKTLSCWHGVRK